MSLDAVLSAPMLAHLAGPVKSLAWAVAASRRDGVIYRFTNHIEDATISGDAYSSQPGLTVSSITLSLGTAVDTLQMTVLTTDDMARADFLTGRWANCRIEFNQFNWKSTSDGFIPWPVYRISNTEPIPQPRSKHVFTSGGAARAANHAVATSSTE